MKPFKLDALSGSEREKARGEAELLRRCSSHSNIVTYIESFMQAPERRGRGSGSYMVKKNIRDNRESLEVAGCLRVSVDKVERCLG